jgi:hypothetical protein
MQTPCPILNDLSAASITLKQLVRRVRKDLNLCHTCTAYPCPGIRSFQETIRQAINEILEELDLLPPGKDSP